MHISTEQNRKPEMNSYTHSPALIFNKVPRIQWEKDSFSINSAGKTGNSHAKTKLDSCLAPYTKLTPKYIKELCIRRESIQFIKETQGKAP